MRTEKPQYPCPSCGFITLAEEWGSYEICAVCFWEDDPIQLEYPDLTGGANKESLRESQAKALVQWPLEITTTGDRRHRTIVRSTVWRPLREDEGRNDGPESGIDYFHAACAAEPAFYWLNK